MNNSEIGRMKNQLRWTKITAGAALGVAMIVALNAHRRARKVEQQIDKEVRRLLTERPPAWAGVGTTGGGQGIP